VQVESKTAFVLGGGGSLGAYEVGMLQALLAAGIVPDLVLGTSVGAINGAVFAADPSTTAIDKLEELWTGLKRTGVFDSPLMSRAATAARSRTHLYSNASVRKLLAAEIAISAIEDLPVRFQCVAACIEEAAEHWFTEGSVVDAVLASSAVPGLLPPVRIGDKHYLDGGLVDSVPVGRAIRLGARRIYVLHVGRLAEPLTPPKRWWQVAAVSFEIARRHRFAYDTADLPEGVQVHVLPTGAEPEGRDWSRYVRYRDFSRTGARIEQARLASSEFLSGLDEG
jgi:NTE family protein